MTHNLTNCFRNITAEEWESITDQNFSVAAKEINSGIAIRSYVDTLLKQIVEDLWNQFYVVNEAFRRRIEETKEAKLKLEQQHYEVQFISPFILNSFERRSGIKV